MSRLDELIKELCPNGVEYKKLGEIATISRGGNFQKKDFCDSGVPCIHYGQIYTKYGLFYLQTDHTLYIFVHNEYMDKYIQSMVCLQIKQLPLLLKNEQKNKNLLK